VDASRRRAAHPAVGLRSLQALGVTAMLASVAAVYLGGRPEGFVVLACVCAGWRWLEVRADRRRLQAVATDRVRRELEARAQPEDGQRWAVALGGLVVGGLTAGELERGSLAAAQGKFDPVGDAVRSAPANLAESPDAASGPRRRAAGRRPSLSGARRR
jgi:hypothetical protein